MNNNTKALIPFSMNGSYDIGYSVTRIERILESNNLKAHIEKPYTIEGNKVDKAD